MSTLPRLRVSSNHRFLETELGEPFFWLGDTAWELFHRLTFEEAVFYLDNRRAKGFNLIQAVAVPELEGLSQANRYGHLPFRNLDPTQPEDAYFDYIAQVIRAADERGLYVGLVTTWADKVKRMWGGEQEIFNPQNAYAYGHYLGTRFAADTNIIWILGGDRSAEGVEEIWRALAKGIDDGAGHHGLKTYHPFGEHSSSEWLHHEDWIDFHMIQSGHGRLCMPTWEMIAADYKLHPVRPVLDGEPNYEDIPIGFNVRNGYFNDYHVRRQAYRSVFAGGFGVTYGHNSVWQMYDQRHQPVLDPLFTWREALDRPGAFQMVHLKNLMLSRPFFERVPGQDLLLTEHTHPEQYICVTRDQNFTYAMAYFPQGGLTAGFHLEPFLGSKVRVWWYDPCNGEARLQGEEPIRRAMSFTSPSEMPDCVLILDDADADYPPPGKVGA
ncbi:putative collagen-binding domain of a collagenase [Anaerolinea thermolimosa]|uniref:apiosidase-like domain-containing protein n=1 Tax=Anaerolinea thermolimosa TaxID=229919 RepID=UPI0007847388|nr:DUF4038 domain-containing protein [Anaerolinea thermolimosa]GAP05976.1 putative collagen-binding domain of a collagenase [Anaerolinea thermolimosa]